VDPVRLQKGVLLRHLVHQVGPTGVEDDQHLPVPFVDRRSEVFPEPPEEEPDCLGVDIVRQASRRSRRVFRAVVVDRTVQPLHEAVEHSGFTTPPATLIMPRILRDISPD
jgi:hypothetical protein